DGVVGEMRPCGVAASSAGCEFELDEPFLRDRHREIVGLPDDRGVEGELRNELLQSLSPGLLVTGGRKDQAALRRETRRQERLEHRRYGGFRVARPENRETAVDDARRPGIRGPPVDRGNRVEMRIQEKTRRALTPSRHDVSTRPLRID